MHAAVTAAAERNGLGAVRQVHRSVRPILGTPSRFILGCTFTAALFVADSGNWLGVMLAAGAGILVDFAFRRWYDPPEPHRIAVCDDGLLLIDLDNDVVSVPWTAITSVAESAARGVIARYRFGTSKHALDIGLYTAHSALLESVWTRQPVPPSPWRRVRYAAVVLTFAGTAAGMVIWPAYLAGVPDNTEIDVVCGADGRGYRDVPAYAGPPPHPIIVVPVEPADLRVHAAPAWQWYEVDDTRDLQLIACVRRLSDTPSGEHCAYTHGLPPRAERQELRTARYEITVYELRTHRVIDRRQLIGDDTTCPEYKSPDEAVYTGVSDAQLHAMLDRHVNQPG